MSDDRPPSAPASDARDEAMASLLRLAGPREPVPTERLERLKTAAQLDWRRQVAVRRRQRTGLWALGGLAAAAAVVLAVRLNDLSDASGPAFVTVESLGRTARLTRLADGDAPTNFQIGDRIPIGAGTMTLDAGAATLRLDRGVIVHLESGTTLAVPSAGAVTLDRGAVYVESGGTGSLDVRTRIGVVHDVGTKFEVRLAPDALRVRVREGAVQVRRESQRHDGRAGDELTIDATGSVSRRVVPVDDPAWARWTTSGLDASATGVAPPFELEGHSLREFLDWIAGENGWELHFADATVEEKARSTTLHGSIDGLTPEQALAAVLETSGVAHQLDGRVLLIRQGARGKD